MSTDPHPPHEEERGTVSHAISLRTILGSPYVVRGAVLGLILGIPGSLLLLNLIPDGARPILGPLGLVALLPVAFVAGSAFGGLVGLHLLRRRVLVPLRELSQRIQDDPSVADHFVERGELYAMELGEFRRAVEDFSRAIELESDDWEAYYLRAAVHYAGGEFEQAVHDCSIAIEGLALSDALVWEKWPFVNLRSAAYYEQADYTSVVADTVRALHLAKTMDEVDEELQAELYYRQAMAYHHLGDVAAAQESFRQAHRRDRWWRQEPRRSRQLVREIVGALFLFVMALLIWELLQAL